MIEVDVRGFSDHMPTVSTQEAIKENPNKVILVIADTVTTKENIVRLGQGKGYTVKKEKVGDDFHIQLIPPRK